MFEFLKDIKELEDVESVEKINKGYSKDEKFKIKLKNKDEYLLLRLSDISLYEQKEKEYEVISKFSKLGFEMSKPISFGICNDKKNVYMLLSWINGVDLSDVLPKLSSEEQYLLGRKAGKILKSIHSLKVDDKKFDDSLKIKLLDKIEKYESSDVRVENDSNFIEYVKRNVDKVCGNYSYLHGDFHPSNLILMENNEIGVIDFNRWEISNSYEEFYKLESFGIEFSIPYCVGQD
ncbi:aminoglycoside phosphotransferase family protein [Parvimonas sp. G1967]|uniref:aminoglycoside phosphotransferase family protein n=1 Tax=Parvimonas sp. G1967 TaxID=3387695 RepID=UPI0039E5BE25